MAIEEMEELKQETNIKTFVANADMKKTVNKKTSNNKQRVGRPKKAIDDIADEQILAKVTRIEKSKVEQYAKSTGISTSSLIKIALKHYGAL
jgi:hypothetical protein